MSSTRPLPTQKQPLARLDFGVSVFAKLFDEREDPLRKKVVAAQERWGPAWTEVVAMTFAVSSEENE